MDLHHSEDKYLIERRCKVKVLFSGNGGNYDNLGDKLLSWLKSSALSSQVLGRHPGGGAVLGRHAEVPHQERQGPGNGIGIINASKETLNI